MTFRYHATELEYADYEYNTTRKNERAVEVPIARRFMADQGDALGLEVGNVLMHYQGGRPWWDIVDRYEGPDKRDVFEIEEPYDWIVSISTLEHVRWDAPEPREPGKSAKAIAHLLSLLQPGGRMLVTVPFGWNPPLDAAILADSFPVERQCSFIREGDGWVQTDGLEAKPYGLTTAWAEAIWVAEFRG